MAAPRPPVKHPPVQPSRQLAELGVRARHSLGQHFLRSEGILDKILAAYTPVEGDILVEIGPGLGALTRRLVATGLPVVAIEKDKTLGPALMGELGSPPNLQVIQADAMNFDWEGLPGAATQRVLVANLPYNVATPLIFRFFERQPVVREALVMIQKEVADRILAREGSDAYGALSVMMGYYTTGRRVCVVPPGAFHPPPRVHSAVIHLWARTEPPFDAGDASRLRRVVSASFQGRRKTLRNALTQGGWDRSTVEDICLKVGISPDVRGETLSLAQFCALSRNLPLSTTVGIMGEDSTPPGDT